MPAESTKQKALDALDGMAQIAKNEMLKPRHYISPEVVDHQLAARGSICRGHSACLIGSLWLGYGIAPRKCPWGGCLFLPGAENSEGFVAHRPGLKLAYGALNEVAQRRIDRLSPSARSRVHQEAYEIGCGPAEALFEALKIHDRSKQLSLIAAAKRIVRAA